MIAGPLCLDTGKSLGTLLFESRTFEDDKPCRGSLVVRRRRHFMHAPLQNVLAPSGCTWRRVCLRHDALFAGPAAFRHTNSHHERDGI